MIIYGEMGGKGGGSAPIEEDDTLSSRQTLRVLYALSNGPITSVDDVYVNRVKLTRDTDGKLNIPGIISDYRVGDLVNAPIRGFSSVENASDETVPISIKKSGNGYKIIRVPMDKDRLKLTMVIERLSQVDEDGNIRKYEVELQFNSSLSPALTNFSSSTAVSVTKSGKSSSPYAFDVVIEKPEIPEGAVDSNWYVLVKRITEDDPLPTKREKYSSTGIAAITEITDIKLTYDKVALIGMTFTKAKRLNGNFPDLIFHVKGIRVPVPSLSFYNPTLRTYTGLWNTTSWDATGASSPNPAWQILYLLRNQEFGLGISDTEIDISAFYEFAKYCDDKIDVYEYVLRGTTWVYEKTGTRFRYELHNHFTEREQATQFLAYFYSNGIARPTITKEGLHTVVWDRPRQPSLIVSNANVIDGLFNYSSNSLEERYTSVSAIYNDANDLGKTTTVTVPIGPQENWEPEEITAFNRYGYRPLTLPVVGCYNADQAIVKARWALYRNTLLPNLLSFSVLFDGLNYEIGDIIKVVDTFKSPIAMQGRFITFSNSLKTFTLDRIPEFQSGIEYTLHYYTSTGNLRSVKVTQTTPLNTVKQVGTFTDPAQGSPYIITSASNEGTLWEIIGLSYSEDSKQITVNCVEYSDKLYEYMYRQVKISKENQYNPVSTTAYDCPPVENVTFTVDEDDVINNSLIVSWDWFYNNDVKIAYNNMKVASLTNSSIIPYANNPYKPEFEVFYRHTSSGDTFTKLENIVINSVEIPTPKEGDYEFKIFAINARGLPSLPTTATYLYIRHDVIKYTLESFSNIPINGRQSQTIKLAKRYELELIEVNGPCRVRIYKDPKLSSTLASVELDRPFANYTPTVLPVTNNLPFLDIEFEEEGIYDLDSVKSKIKIDTSNSLVYDSALYNRKSTVVVDNTSAGITTINVSIWYRVLQ